MNVQNEISEDDLGVMRSLVTFRLARVQNRLGAQASALLSSISDASLSEWRVMRLVHVLGETSATQIAQSADMDKGQVSRTVKRLSERGLLQVSADQSDHRQSRLTLTKSGHVLHDHLLKAMKDRQRHLMRDIPAEDLQAFFRVLDLLDERSKTRLG